MSREDDERRCPFCHEWVPADRFDRHVGRHQERRADGQMRDHVTLPPGERRRGRLDDVPTVYVHRRCGEATRMPDDIIRSYLKNPFLYNGETFCCGCNTYVPWRQCRWEDTGQPLDEYFEELRAEARRDGRGPSLIGQFGLPEWVPYAACGCWCCSAWPEYCSASRGWLGGPGRSFWRRWRSAGCSWLSAPAG